MNNIIKIKYSIIIPTFNGSKYISTVVESLIKQNYNKENFEIIIVDNASTDNTKKISHFLMKKYNDYNIRYIYEPIPGLLSGRHRGAKEAKGEILTFIDDDIIADQNWLSAINETFKNPSVMLVGGKSLPNYEADPPEWMDWFWIKNGNVNICGSLSLLDYGDEEIEFNANYIWGLNFSIRKKALLELGGFHPDGIGGYGDCSNESDTIASKLQQYQGDGETGLTIKAKEQGYKAIYQPKALVYHKIPQGRMTYEFFENRFYFQGVSDSYQYFRRKYGKYAMSENHKTKIRSKMPEPIKKLLRFVKNLLFKQNEVCKQSKQEVELRERFRKAYQQGYNFHQNAVANNPELLEWILKDDYWDYSLPKIEDSSNIDVSKKSY